MATQDISRLLHQPKKHYSTVYLQQGRPLLDHDWNERAAIETEDLRASLVDMMSAKGTPNDGMLVTGVEVPLSPVSIPLPSPDDTYATYDFEIGAGSYYLGGRRLAVDGAAETFLTQRDWLYVDFDPSNLPGEVEEEGERIDLVYLVSWDQPVTAVEDRELLEAALGGRDTSTRIKRMRRVAVEELVLTTPDPTDAWTEFKTTLLASVTASFDDGNAELVSSALLSVGFETSNQEEDLCAEPTDTGYVAAHNQAIRVELRAGQTFVWGYDNASKLYRVTVDEDERTLTFLNEPEDLASMPRTGQVVELLPWSAKLPNDEKVAELQGVLAEITTGYDPTAKTIVIEEVDLTQHLDWLDLHDEHGNPDDPVEERKYMFLRVWDRGAELVDISHPAEQGYEKGLAYSLGDSGLSITIEEHGVPGDYWIIAARPETPNVVTPWDLADGGGVPPHGPKRFYAPLALIHWTDGSSSLDVYDGRTKLRQLDDGGSNTITVGDEKTSFGQVPSLSEAIELVPNGGTILMLPGEHEGAAVLQDRTDITIEGFGPQTVLIRLVPTDAGDETSNPEEFYPPCLSIRDCERIRVSGLRILTHSAVGISIERTETNTCDDIEIDNVQILATGLVSPPDKVYEYTAPAIAVLAATGVDIHDCFLGQDSVPGITPTVLLGGSRLRLRNCEISSHFDGRQLNSLGGVTVRSYSNDVEISGCIIDGGWGHGISLGHIGSSPSETVWPILTSDIGKQFDWLIPEGSPNWLEYRPNGAKIATEKSGSDVWLPYGPVENVRVQDNVIRRMGLSGISTSEFFDSTYEWTFESPGPVFIVAANLEISRNRIEENVAMANLPETLGQYGDRCVGGVCLAAAINLVVRENIIVHNGNENLRVPVCGIGIIGGQNVTIEDNIVTNNGRQLPESEEDVQRGLRGGIVIVEATPTRGYTFPESGYAPTMPEPVIDYSGVSGGSAVVLRGNEVSQPIGRALWIQRSHGAVTVTGNTLESFGNPQVRPTRMLYNMGYGDATGASIRRPVAGHCVELIGYSKALDIGWTGTSPDPDPAQIPSPDWVDVDSLDPLEDGGDTVFSHNEVRMNWTVAGGISSAVLISTLASAAFNDNDVTVSMNSSISSGDIAAFHAAVMSEPEDYSWVMSTVWVAGLSIGQAHGNRITEGMYDALASLTLGTVVAPIGTDLVNIVYGVAATANMLSHNLAVVASGIIGVGVAKIVNTANVIIHEFDQIATVEQTLDTPVTRTLPINET